MFGKLFQNDTKKQTESEEDVGLVTQPESNTQIANEANAARQGKKKDSSWLKKLNPKKALYKARLNAKNRRNKVVKGAHDIGNQDVVLEQLAHHGAYGRLDNTKLAAWGYREAGAANDPESGFRVVCYLPTAEATADTDEGRTIRAMHGGEPPAVIAFRGTSNARGWADDTNREGIGTYQFTSNAHRIEQIFGVCGGKALVTGHSLGGALAQLAACRYPGNVSRIVTFQSAGIDTKEAKKLEQHNATAKPEDQIKSTHHRVEGDIVNTSGDALTPGDVYIFESVGIGTPLDHTKFPLARLNAARGGVVPGVTNQKGKEAKDKLVRVKKTTSKKAKNTVANDVGEWGRKNPFRWLKGNPDMEPFVRFWGKVKQMCESDDFTISYVLGIIAQTDQLTDNQKIKMRDAVNEKYG